MLDELTTAGEILNFLQYIDNIDEGKQFIKTYIKAINKSRSMMGDDPLEYRDVIKYIVSVDERFTNMI